MSIPRSSFIRFGIIGIGITSGFVTYSTFVIYDKYGFGMEGIISNDIHAIDTSIHELLPNKQSETYKMGLFEASQQEEKQQYDNYRRQLLNGSLGVIYYVYFTVEDYILDPLITFTRFLELSAIFLPVLISSPICFFGRRIRDKNSTERIRSGAKLWFAYLRWSAEMAGASFIKLGQWAASRTDIFPKAMCDELGSMHSNAKPHSLSQTKIIISESFGNLPFDEIFDEFNETPLGVGAIAQVYIGKLSPTAINQARSEERKSLQSFDHAHEPFLEKILVTEQNDPLTSNQYVAIKVLHPKVEIKINRDLKIMKFFAEFINVIPTMEWLSLPEEVEQFSVLMRLQLDLRIEAMNLTKFRSNFKNRLDIHFPKPYLNFTTRNILVEEFIHAIPMSKLLSLTENFGKNLSKEVSDKGLDAFLKMLILDNFVHADLHPGNMMVRFYKNELFKHEREYKIVKSSNEIETNRITNELLKLGDDSEAWCTKLSTLYDEGYHAEICFLDVGLVTELNHVDRINFIDLFRSLSEFDGYRAGELMIERSRTPDTAINKEIFALKVEKLVDRMKERTFTLGNISIGDLLDQVLNMVRNHHVRMEGDFITVIVAILLLEGLGRQLDPELDLFASSLPVLRQLGVSKEGRDILRNENASSMVKVWLALEVRQFINASIQDIHSLVKADMLSPNV
ncbi:putative ABC1 family protein, mitochondrial precursor [Scheffersomyces coipomensis]|uniref:putative ABC1 family protein, mitochondrial precursor n=1 Tax=Scheffersomyces coipomensis TaxID=1788519 RepID=UPI00315C6D72